MNGTLLLRRSASMLLAGSLLFVAACGVELNGLFEGDAGVDGTAPRDGGQDAPASDRAPDTRPDTTTDAAAIDGNPIDRSSTDTAIDRGGTDTAIEPPPDGTSGVDAMVDTTADGGRDALVDRDAVADARVDNDGPRDASSDAPDAPAEDASTDPNIDSPADIAVDVVADVARDVVDAGPPGTCGGGCNTFDNISQTVIRKVDQGPPPAMTGGTLVDGTYVVTDIVQYNGDNTMFTLAETSVIGGNMDAWVSSTNGQAPVRYTTTFTTMNNQLAFTFCCPSAGNLTILYTTDGNTLSHVDPANPNRIITYTRQ